MENHREKKKGKRGWKILLLTAEGLLLLFLLVCLFVQRKYEKIEIAEFEKEEIQVNTDIPEKEVEKMKLGYRTIALFGVDAGYKNQLDKGVHGDTVMIASINQDTGAIRLASIYRDTYLDIGAEGEEEYGKLTAAYFNGGPKNAMDALNRNFDLNIREYAAVNWAGLATAVNDLGGLTIDVPKEMLKDNMINGYITETVKSTGIGSVHLKRAGTQVLDGVQTVAYCRVRYMKGSDYGRAQRQREVLVQLMEKAKGADLGSLNKLADDVLSHMSTNLELSDILSLAAEAKSYYLEDTCGFPLEDNRVNVTIHGGDMVVARSLEDTAAELHSFLYATEEYVPSQTVQEIGEHIREDARLEEGEKKYSHN